MILSYLKFTLKAKNRKLISANKTKLDLNFISNTSHEHEIHFHFHFWLEWKKIIRPGGFTQLQSQDKNMSSQVQSSVTLWDEDEFREWKKIDKRP